MTESIDPTEGRVYGGARNLIHLADGTREEFGAYMATQLDMTMRNRAVRNKSRTPEQAWGDPDRQQPRQQLCPGCYMVAIVATAVALAERNGQSITELGNSLSKAFADLAKYGADARNMEWIDVQLDSAQPSPGGQGDALSLEMACSEMHAVVQRAGGYRNGLLAEMLEKGMAALAARQPVGEPQQQAQDDGDMFVAMARAGINTFPGVPL